MLPVPTSEEREKMDREGRLDIREALNIFAACELPLLQDPTARIEIVGHADRPHDEKSNLALSTNRAYSVRNYLHGILGNRLTFRLGYHQLDPDRLIVEGKGETEAKKAGTDDDVSDQRFRRVDLRVAVQDPTAAEPEDEFRDVVLDLKILGADDPAKR